MCSGYTNSSQTVSNISSVTNQQESLADGPVSVSQMLRGPAGSDARGTWMGYHSASHTTQQKEASV